LPADTLRLLQEFNTEKDARAKQFEELKAKAEDDFDGKLSMDLFGEDWNASQVYNIKDSWLASDLTDLQVLVHGRNSAHPSATTSQRCH
jgi:hypothetical protein